MKFKKHLLSAILVAVFAVTATAQAETAKEALLTAKSESGVYALDVRIVNGDGKVSAAKLTSEQGTIDLMPIYDANIIVDMPNHILTICFLEKVKPSDDIEDAKSVKVWATPSSFVKTPKDEFNWRFKLKVGGNILKDGITMNGTYEWKP